MSYVRIRSCCLRKCLRHAQIHLQYGQLYMSYAYLHWCYMHMWHAVFDMLYVLYATCPVLIHYDISIMFCNKSENFYVVSKNPFVCFNSFVKGAKIALCVNFCCVQFAMLYLQKHSSCSRLFMLPCKIMWHCQIQLLTFTFELFSDMTLAWDPTVIKYPIIKYSWYWFSQIKYLYFWLAFVTGTLAQ